MVVLVLEDWKLGFYLFIYISINGRAAERRFRSSDEFGIVTVAGPGRQGDIALPFMGSFNTQR